MAFPPQFLHRTGLEVRASTNARHLRETFQPGSWLTNPRLCYQALCTELRLDSLTGHWRPAGLNEYICLLNGLADWMFKKSMRECVSVCASVCVCVYGSDVSLRPRGKEKQSTQYIINPDSQLNERTKGSGWESYRLTRKHTASINSMAVHTSLFNHKHIFSSTRITWNTYCFCRL